MFTMSDIKHLLERTDSHTLSLYLSVDPSIMENQATNPAWRIALKNILRKLDSEIAGDQRAIWQGIRARLDDYFLSYIPESKSLALFIGPTVEEIIPLPLPLENRGTFGSPLISPLLWVIDEYKPYLVVLVDQEKARLITAYLGAAETEAVARLELDTSEWREKTMQATSGAVDRLAQRNARDDFAERVDQIVQQFYQEVGAAATNLVSRIGANRIILGGNEQSAHSVHDLLPEKTRKMVVAIVPFLMRSPDHEVLEKVLPLALEYERKAEMKLLENIVNMAKADGRAVLGRDKVLDALARKHVELLVAPWPMDDHDLVARLPLQVVEMGSAVELVHGEAAEYLNAHGGLAARLYYTIR
jgi:peptide subunit release factor 1 (eRF1)